VDERPKKPPAIEASGKYALRLYVAGRSSNGTKALHNVTRFLRAMAAAGVRASGRRRLKEPEAAAVDGNRRYTDAD
jgi:hypothetical protein